MKILVVTEHFWPENFRINDLVSGLCARGHEITVLTGWPNYPGGEIFTEFSAAPENFSRYAAAKIVRVPIIPRGTRSWKLLLNYLSFVLSASTLGVWRLRRQKFDVIFVFEPSPVTVGLPAALLRRLKRAPVAFWVLDLWPETLSAIGVVRSRLGLAMVGKLVSFIYRHCDLILAQSKSFITHIARYAPANTDIRYFPNWAEVLGAAEQSAPEINRCDGMFSVLFAGNVGQAQDFPAILAAAEQLRHHPDIRWLIVGDGRHAAWVREEIERRDLGSTVLMLGRFALERMPSFFLHADALLVSLKSDPIFSMTIPGKVQSYLAAGIPLLGMLDGEGARVIEEAGAGLACAAGDSSALAHAVLKLKAMPLAERKSMGDNGRIYSLREFDRDGLFLQLESWLEQLREQQRFV